MNRRALVTGLVALPAAAAVAPLAAADDFLNVVAPPPVGADAPRPRLFEITLTIKVDHEAVAREVRDLAVRFSPSGDGPNFISAGEVDGIIERHVSIEVA